eukprot:CAMPEP_0185845244 /NCGR_PEP_ID=MMETSP1354-20130828/1263_1 /TAXON_ID=708628 /ORGANISM="Erythrolobus madagascarensis, Strain CCMP3276" /LENGTH=124 /DNA_ID=CAMNT_0028545159 /DNA_START=59 /DNA_END=430 /DNA_ORIENTATION=+
MDHHEDHEDQEDVDSWDCMECEEDGVSFVNDFLVKLAATNAILNRSLHSLESVLENDALMAQWESENDRAMENSNFKSSRVAFVEDTAFHEKKSKEEYREWYRSKYRMFLNKQKRLNDENQCDW